MAALSSDWNEERSDLIREVGALREQVARLRAASDAAAFLFEESFDAVVVVNDGGAVLDANQAAAELFGCPKDRLIGVSFGALTVREGQEPVKKRLEECRRTGHWRGELRFLDASGAERITTAVGRRFAEDVQWWILRDLTARPAARPVEDGEYFRLAAQAIDGYFFDFDAARGTVHRSDGFFTLTGYAWDEKITAPTWWQHLLHPDDRDATLRAFAEAAADPTVDRARFEYRILHRDGHGLDVLGTMVFVRDDTGAIVRLVGSVIDISEQKRNEAALRHGQALHAAVFEAATDALFVVDPETLLTLDCNPRAVELFGAAAKSDLLGIEGGRSLHKTPLTEDERKTILAGMRSRGAWSGEFEYVTLTGNAFWGNLAARQFRGNGKSLNLVRVTDITDRKRIELALRESERRFAAFFKAIPLACSISTLDEGRFVEVNDQLIADIGLPADRIIGRTSVELGLWVDAVDRARMARVLTAEGVLRDHEFTYWRVSGEAARLVCYGTVIELNNAPHVLSMLVDVTTARAREERLRLLESVVVNMDDAVLITEAEPIDTPGPRIVYVNAAFEAMTGYAAAEVLNKTPRLLQGPGTSREALDEIRRALTEWRPCRVEVLNYRKDGGEFWVDITISPVAVVDGRLSHWIGVQRDITERKLAEAKIKTALTEKEVLLREIHHRVKNNLQLVSSLIDLHLIADNDPRVEAFKADVQNRINAMALIHQTLLRPDNTFGGVEMTRFARTVLESQVQFHRAGNVTIEVSGEMVVLPLDTAIPVGLILNELASNAFKHAFPAGRVGTIHILFQVAADRLDIAVSDDGIGLPPQTTRAESLGLRLVGLLTRQIRGTLHFNSERPGTRVTLAVPLTRLSFKDR